MFTVRLPEGPALIGVSGGVDSMVLLHLLAKCPKVQVAHLNHQLRGKASDGDEQLVRRTAKKLGVPCHVERADVRRLAREQKLSIEMAARQCRHEFFARLARQLGIKTVALAHHADDQVELFLLRLLRGAGPEGLSGMRDRGVSPVDASLAIIRPLLHVTKEEILACAAEHKIAFHEDATNASTSILRNRIRHKLIPLLKRDYQPALARAILRAMELLRADLDVIADRGGEPFDNLPVALQRRRLRQQLYAAGIDANFNLVEHLRLHQDVPINTTPEQLVARNASGTIKLSKPLPNWSANSLSAILNKPGSLNFGGLTVQWSFAKGKTGPNRECFDAAKVGERIVLRHWQPGDRFQPIGMKTSAKLQDIFTNCKISRDRRRGLVVAATEKGEIFWVEGLRIAEQFKIEPSTQRRLQWSWHRHETC